MKKRGLVIFTTCTAIIIVFLFLAGCKQDTGCQAPKIIINDTCCQDSNLNYICDAEEGLVCGDSICHETENCSTCWQDCGVCKTVKVIYYPTNFSLKNITTRLDPMFKEKLVFRKDIEAKDNVSDHFIHEEKHAKYLADFMGNQYHPIKTYDRVILSKIKLDQWYLNHTDSTLDWTNYSRWYLIQLPINNEREWYMKRFYDNTAKNAYPTPPTGHEKTDRYKGWIAMNFTEKESVIMNSVEQVGSDRIMSVYASITNYTIKYQTGNLTDKDWDDNEYVLYDYKDVTEMKLNYYIAMTTGCARNLAVTVYDYDFDIDTHNINREDVLQEIEAAKKRLMLKIQDIDNMCAANYRYAVFVPNSPQ